MAMLGPVAAARPLLVGVEERVQHVVPRGQRANVPLAQKLAHDGQPVEHLREDVVVPAAGRRLRVVLGELHSAGVGDEERVEPRHRTRVAKAGLDVHELMLPLHQPELREELLVGEGGLVRRAKGAQHHGAALLEKAILRRREKARAQHGAERAVAEEEAALPQLFVELALRLTADVVGEQRVILVDAVAQHASGSAPGGRAGTRPR